MSIKVALVLLLFLIVGFILGYMAAKQGYYNAGKRKIILNSVMNNRLCDELIVLGDKNAELREKLAAYATVKQETNKVKIIKIVRRIGGVDVYEI